MQFRSVVIFAAALCLAIGAACWKLAPRAMAQSQQAVAGSENSADAKTQVAGTDGKPTFKTETRLVLVDSVVTDKKGNYIRDLTAKDFRVWEDNKEKSITSFSFGVDPAADERSQQKYLVLFFDNSTMDFGDQIKARQAAAKFIDSNAAPNRPMAIVDFGGAVHVAQNFTVDAERLKKVVAGLQTSWVAPNTQPVEMASLGVTSFGTPNLGSAEADFGARSVMLALRSVARSLSTVPGRKILVMLTSGFPLNTERQSEIPAVISECNKANVAIYPIDIRGLVVPDMGIRGPGGAALHYPADFGSAHLSYATLRYDETFSGHPKLLPVALSQRGGAPAPPAGGGGRGPAPAPAPAPAPRGGGTGGTGGTSGSSSGRGTTSGSNSVQAYATSPYAVPNQLVPLFPASASDNQQVLYQLAAGTGGFVILNTNDLLGGLQKIAREQSEYYILGYSPSESAEGSCHTLKVKVDRGGTVVRSRSGYCNVRPRDLLAGNSIEKGLESHASADLPGNVTGAMQTPFFYTSPNTARVDLALEIPSGSLKFEKVKGKMHSEINVLGIAYKPDNTIAARFSDTVNLDFEDKHQVEEFQKLPFHYQNQFEILPGKYTLKVVFSSGNESFGKLEKHLSIDPYSGKEFTLSGLALTNQIHHIEGNETGLDVALLEDKTPLVVRGMEITPSASNRFKKTDSAAIYVEVYEPLLASATPPKVGLEIIVLDRATKEKTLDIGVPDTEAYIQKGNPVIPLAFKLPTATLAPGSYQVQMKALDTAGRSSTIRSSNFEVE